MPFARPVPVVQNITLFWWIKRDLSSFFASRKSGQIQLFELAWTIAERYYNKIFAEILDSIIKCLEVILTAPGIC